MGAISIADQMEEILQGVTVGVREATDEALQKVPKRAAAKLKSVSPKHKGRYASGWKTKKEDGGVVVYNATLPGYTHLLNNGHVIKNKYGEYGRYNGDNHIGQVEDEFNEIFLDEVLRNLNKEL